MNNFFNIIIILYVIKIVIKGYKNCFIGVLSN